jgi:hypothetical protein
MIVGPNSTVDAPNRGSTKIRLYNGSDWSQLPATYTANGIRVAAADFNHDGCSDIITTGTVYDAANGNVLFTFPTTGSGNALAAGDVNGDGTADILVGDTSGMISLYSGVDQHTILNTSIYSLTGDASFSGLRTTMTLADINQDGFSDLVFNTGFKLAMVSGADYSVAIQNLVTVVDASGPGEIVVFVQVPEAGTLGALVCGTLVLLRRRR